MNFNDFRVKAYGNLNRSDAELLKEDAAAASMLKKTMQADGGEKKERIVSKPIFPVVSKNQIELNALLKNEAGLSQSQPGSAVSPAPQTQGQPPEQFKKFTNFEKLAAAIPTKSPAPSFQPTASKPAFAASPKGGEPYNAFFKVPSSFPAGIAKKTDDDGKDSVYRRVAKFLVLIGIDEAAKILPHLTEEQTEKIIPEIASIKKIDPAEGEEILGEFRFLVQKARESGGVQTAKNILEKAFGSERANELLEKTVPFGDGKPFEFLAEADGEKVSALLKDESNPVRAIVLIHLDPKVAAEVIKSLPDAEKKDIIVRLAKMKEVNPDIVRRIDKSMQEKLRKLTIVRSDRIDGQSTLAEILKRMNPKAEEEILSNLADENPELGENLRELLFTTQDILNADDKYLQNKLREMNDLDGAFLIAGKGNEFRDKILSNVSTTRKRQILDTEDLKKPMRRSDCEKITSQFFSEMRRAYEDGELYIKGRDDDYV